MTPDTLSVVIAAILPVVVRFIKRAHYPQIYNAFIAIVVYALAGVAAVIVSGQTFDINNIVPSVGLFTATGTVAYQLFWKNLEEPEWTNNVA